MTSHTLKRFFTLQLEMGTPPDEIVNRMRRYIQILDKKVTESDLLGDDRLLEGFRRDGIHIVADSTPMAVFNPQWVYGLRIEDMAGYKNLHLSKRALQIIEGSCEL